MPRAYISPSSTSGNVADRPDLNGESSSVTMNSKITMIQSAASPVARPLTTAIAPTGTRRARSQLIIT